MATTFLVDFYDEVEEDPDVEETSNGDEETIMELQIDEEFNQEKNTHNLKEEENNFDFDVHKTETKEECYSKLQSRHDLTGFNSTRGGFGEVKNIKDFESLKPEYENKPKKVQGEKCNDKCKQKKQNEINWFQCNKCSYKTKNYHLKRHVIAMHANENELKWFECDKCGYKSKYKPSLRRHIIILHRNEDETEWFQCDKCGYKTKHKDSLKRHMITLHRNEDETEWFQCDKCGYKTKHKNSLKRHLMTFHSKIEWCQCEKCVYKGKNKDALRQHIMRVHQNEDETNWFWCEKCGYKAKLKHHLQRHMISKHG